MDTISRKLSWDNGSRSHDAKLAMKRAMAHFMSDKRTSEAEYVNPDKVQSWSDDISGLRPGRNIEDAERDAIDHLFRSRGKASYEHDLWMSPLRNIQNYLASHHAPKDVSPEDVLTATTDHHNVPLSPSQVKFKGSVRHNSNRRRHLRKAATPESASPVMTAEGPAPASSTPGYNDSDIHTRYSNATRHAETYGPMLWNEPDGLPDKCPEEKSKAYSDLDKYKPVSWNEPEGLRPKTPEELSKNYSDLPEYTAVKWNEPNGLPASTPEELSKNYDDLDKYTAVHWNEPDGLPNSTPEELSKKYEDLDKYKPIEWNEPEGLREPTLEEQSKNYDDLDTYSEPFTAPEEVIDAHAASQMDPATKAEPIQAKVDVVSPPADYDDLHKYGPVHWNEPDGLQKPTPEEASKNYDDLHLYGAVQWNEPDGLPKLTAEEQSKNYEDLQAYDEELRLDAEIVSSRAHPEEASKAYDDLDLYRSTKMDSVDTPYPTHPEEATKAYQDLEEYKPVYHNEPKGVASEHSSSEYTGLDAFDKLHHTEHFGSHPNSRSRHYFQQDLEDLESLTAAQIRARMSCDKADQDRHRKLDEDKAHHDSTWDVASVQAQETVQQSKQTAPESLTGNYVRDFPEDFTESWSARSESASLLPEHMQGNDSRAAAIPDHSCKDDFELSSMDESFPMTESRIEPALDRVTSTRHLSGRSPMHDIVDPYSKIPQGLETSYEVECEGVQTWPTMVSHYHSKTADGKTSPSAPGASQEPTAEEGTYKVLAFDRTTQSVNVAEMTSGVLDQQQPLSPAEVMLKLSNPARFLPHFASLHSQGYEVISGSGDVLIFRKVRPASPDIATEYLGQNPVNPIDLMGRPVMGNFASPTGFVNYESLADSDNLKPEPPFRSNIEVRKEEPVFSGSRADQEPSRPKRKSLGRRIIVGGTLTVGIAYAVGVMAEFFSTGGLDGLGPRGL
jgi:hypothetical protein